MNEEDTEYIQTDYLDEARLAIDYKNSHTEATALALIAIAQELRETNGLLRRIITKTGELEVRVVGGVEILTP